MICLTRRMFFAGASATAAGALAGCVSSNPNPAIYATAVPPPAPEHPGPVDAVEPSYHEIYAAVKDGNFTVPSIDLSQVDSAFLRKNVAYVTNEQPGTIVVDPGNHYLYHVEGGGRATRYGIGVGRDGFRWAGEATIHNKQEWPDWLPPDEMLGRRPELRQEVVQLHPKGYLGGSGQGMPGSPANPLGARAMYLWHGNTDTGFRIHGTNEPWTIGGSQSSGCIRMLNQDAIDLYNKTPVGTRVVVLGSPNAVPLKLVNG